MKRVITRVRVATAGVAIAASSLAGLMLASTASASTTPAPQLVRPQSATGCTYVGEHWWNSPTICLHVQGSGLYVDYAQPEAVHSDDPGVVFDTDHHMARHYITGNTRVYVQRDLPNGDRVCYADQAYLFWGDYWACDTIHS